MMITLALRVLGSWFVLGVALGLCWTAACFTARRASDTFAGMAVVGHACGLLGALLLPAADRNHATQGELFSFGLGLAQPTRATAARVALTRSRLHSQA